MFIKINICIFKSIYTNTILHFLIYIDIVYIREVKPEKF